MSLRDLVWPASGHRAFEFREGNSAKFWRIRRHGCAYTVHFGRLGSAGQGLTKRFATEGQARWECARLIREKRRKGYVEVAAPEDGTAQGAAAEQLRLF